jgi:hypothetical protein
VDNALAAALAFTPRFWGSLSAAPTGPNVKAGDLYVDSVTAALNICVAISPPGWISYPAAD